jgi:hypothetical protein
LDVSVLISVKSKSRFVKLIVLFGVLSAVCIISGCAAEFSDPLDLYGQYYEYSVVSGSDGEYIILTKHLASESDVKIPDSIYDLPVKKIGESVFAGDSRIKSVTLSENIQEIGCNAFGGCTELESIEFTDNLTAIGDYAFTNCTALKSIALPDNIQSVGRGAFYDCTSLVEISIPSALSSIGGRAFADTPWLKSMAKSEFVAVGDGVLIQYNGSDALVELPESVKKISGAFAGNTNVQKVTLNKNLTEIGDMAFMGCTSLTSIKIPSNVTAIGSQAFYGCTALKSLSMSDNVKYIGEDAFEYCGAQLPN